MWKIGPAVMFFVLGASALAAAPENIPTSLYRVDGKPVPSSCLADLAGLEGPKTINLAHCGNPSMKPKSLPSGVVGYEDLQGGYFYYRYLGNTDGLDVLYTEYSGGGSGHFTSLVGIVRNGQTLTPKKNYAFGDRCNGGLSNAALANGRLTFDQAITPYDLIALADPKTKLKAYKDLDASATGCIGRAHKTIGNEGWTGVRLTQKSLNNNPEWLKYYRYQACFNTLYSETFEQGRTELDRNGVKAFAADFNKRCVAPT